MSNIVFKADSTTAIVNGYTLKNLPAGDEITIAPANARTSRTYGAGRKVNIKRRADGDVYTITIRVLRASDDDIFLTDMWNRDVMGFGGSFKELRIVNGNEEVHSWKFTDASFTTGATETFNNTDGSEVMEYTIEAFADRIM